MPDAAARPAPSRTKVLSVHRLERTARKWERILQQALDRLHDLGLGVRTDVDGNFRVLESAAPQYVLPIWTRGVRVEPIAADAGKAKPWPKGTPRRVRNRTQYAVVATEHRGH